MDVSPFIFYPIALALIFFASMVVLKTNPVFSSLYLALTMIGLSLVFFLLQSFFIAGVQLIVYAGAVIVMFVMVLMMFDLKQEEDPGLQDGFFVVAKVTITGLVGGLFIGAILLSVGTLKTLPFYAGAKPAEITTKLIAKKLFTHYAFAFEALGVLLLVVAIGAVVVSRIKGGTHAQSE